jgi:hypothetical protein
LRLTDEGEAMFVFVRIFLFADARYLFRYDNGFVVIESRFFLVGRKLWQIGKGKAGLLR